MILGISFEAWHIIGAIGMIIWFVVTTIRIRRCEKLLDRLKPTDFGHELMCASSAPHARAILSILRQNK